MWWYNYLLDVLLDTLIENKPAIIVITSRKRLKGECYELLDSNIGHKSILNLDITGTNYRAL